MTNLNMTFFFNSTSNLLNKHFNIAWPYMVVYDDSNRFKVFISNKAAINSVLCLYDRPFYCHFAIF